MNSDAYENYLDETYGPWDWLRQPCEDCNGTGEQTVPGVHRGGYIGPCPSCAGTGQGEPQP